MSNKRNQFSNTDCIAGPEFVDSLFLKLQFFPALSSHMVDNKPIAIFPVLREYTGFGLQYISPPWQHQHNSRPDVLRITFPRSRGRFDWTHEKGILILQL